MSIVYISLGSNLGDRLANLRGAIELLETRKKLKIKRKSSIYETEPVGGPPQGYFLNQVIEVETDFISQGLFKILKKVEKQLGRKKGLIWGPRLIDLDILLFGDLIIKEENLEIPHPRLTERKFVLVPLSEINSGLYHPVIKKKIKDILKELKDDKEVKFYQKSV